MPTPRVVIIGGGFAGLAAANRLARRDFAITLIDRHNHHLFQPLLYQVATGGLSPANIAAPLRSLFRNRKNVAVLQQEVAAVDTEAKVVQAEGEQLPYDFLIVAAGGQTNYFGHADWEEAAPGLKTLEDATLLRGRVLAAIERAEASPGGAPPAFVLAGGGPTGVEMAGAIAELTRQTLAGEFRRIDPADCRVVLADPGDRLLAGYPPKLSDRAADRLAKLGVEVRLGEQLLDVGAGHAVIGRDEEQERIEPAVTIWAAGVSAVGLASRLGLPEEVLGLGGRIRVNDDLSIPGADGVFAVGDIALLEDAEGNPLPGVAPVAIQQGKHAANNVIRISRSKSPTAFRYRDYGSMAVIGRGAAVASLAGWNFSGLPAWLAWLFVHLLQLVGHQNRLLVAVQWGWNYLTRNRSARLVVEEDR